MPTYSVHNDAGDLVGYTRDAARVAGLVTKAVNQNLRDPHGPLDGRFGRVNISAVDGPRWLGQVTLTGYRLHPLVRSTVTRGIADALAAPRVTPSPDGGTDTVLLADIAAE